MWSFDLESRITRNGNLCDASNSMVNEVDDDRVVKLEEVLIQY